MIHLETREGRCSLSIKGEFTVVNAAAMKDRIMQSLVGATHINVDLSQVDEMDTAGVQLLVLLKREAQGIGNGIEFRVDSMSSAALELIELYNMQQYLTSV